MEAQKRRARVLTKKIILSGEESAKEVERSKLLLSDVRGQIVLENDLERTWKAKQRDILEDADDNTRAKVMNLKLNQSYSLRFTANGRHLVMGGSKGHVAVVDALRSRVITEVQLENEHVFDVTPLHNETLFAVAQKKYVYIYDHTGMEIHQLRTHIEPRKLEFLPFHYLLCSIGRSSRLVYEDVSTGTLVANLRTKMGPTSVLCQNRTSAVLGTGHTNGVIALWAPTNGEALVKVLCHPAPITSMCFFGPHAMATAALDGRVNTWDCRMLGTKMNSYAIRRNALSLSVSDTGLLAMGTGGSEVLIWKDLLSTTTEKQQDPYLHYRCAYDINQVDFRPFEDVLGIGHSQGVETIVVPGAGEANFDAFEHNPFERKTQRRDTEVRKLLDKLPADTIGLGSIGEVYLPGVEKASQLLRTHHTKEDDKDDKDDKDDVVLSEPAALPEKERVERRKMKGRGRIGSRLKVKHRNIITQEREKKRTKDDEFRMRTATSRNEDKMQSEEPGMHALSQLMKKKSKRSS